MTATHIWTDRTFSVRNPGGIAVMVPARRGATAATCDVQQASKDLRLRLSGRSCGGSWVSDTSKLKNKIKYIYGNNIYCFVQVLWSKNALEYAQLGDKFAQNGKPILDKIFFLCFHSVYVH